MYFAEIWSGVQKDKNNPKDFEKEPRSNSEETKETKGPPQTNIQT